MGLTKKTYMLIYKIIGVALIVILLYGLYQTVSINSMIKSRIAEAEEAARPAILQLTTIEDQNCKDCFSINSVVNRIKSNNINITKEDALYSISSEAKELIKKYNLKKVPAIILTGETAKAKLNGFEARDDALIFSEIKPPYVDLALNNIVGRVSSTIIKDSACEKCPDMANMLKLIKDAGIKVTAESTLEISEAEAKSLIEQYSIRSLPAMILSKDISAYENIAANWKSIGTVESDGSYIARSTMPPYLNLTTNKVVGLVDLIYVTDKSCTECYDPKTFHEPIIERFGVAINSKKELDVSDEAAKSLIEKYSIKKAPTIILAGDVSAYAGLVSAWKSVGTVESDSAYVFRNVEIAGEPYKDLVKNEVVKQETK